ncbi:Hypothetical protein SMAX5B_000165 [Scophthalmus maximus]|uniref:Uncharacterized protein n=1 Tax=Scophthalmus maximus TaxID=52904 RepID=A0A2U9CUV7_SCOMX|nr:Hypothetical protein SMAX5B_000165 [Scophthalmus maximus]
MPLASRLLRPTVPRSCSVSSTKAESCHRGRDEALRFVSDDGSNRFNEDRTKDSDAARSVEFFSSDDFLLTP